MMTGAAGPVRAVGKRRGGWRIALVAVLVPLTALVALAAQRPIEPDEPNQRASLPTRAPAPMPTLAVPDPNPVLLPAAGATYATAQALQVRGRAANARELLVRVTAGEEVLALSPVGTDARGAYEARVRLKPPRTATAALVEVFDGSLGGGHRRLAAVPIRLDPVLPVSVWEPLPLNGAIVRPGMSLAFTGASRKPLVAIQVTLLDGLGRVVAMSVADLSDLGRQWLRWSATVEIPLGIAGGQGSVEIQWKPAGGEPWSMITQSVTIYG